MCGNKIGIASRWTKTLRRKSNVVKRGTGSVLKALAILLVSVSALGARAADLSRVPVINIVTQIQRADYEGDRTALKRLYGELTPFAQNKDLASRVRYWRGFALWRRAINGFNERVDARELETDLQQAVDEFEESARKDPGFVDAKVGALSCLGFLAFALNQKDPARVQELITHGRQMRKDAEAQAPENPRLLWVMSVNIWWSPVERGGGQAKAMETLKKGLQVIRNQKRLASDPLEPTWGEPELLMSLAWCELNRTTPDVNAAEQYAHAALDLVPYWHYVKDVLMPQIQEAKKKAAAKNPVPLSLILRLPSRGRGAETGMGEQEFLAPEDHSIRGTRFWGSRFS